MLAADQIRAGSARTVLAGGFESMTNAPVPAAEGPRRLPLRARRDLRPHALRRAAEPVGRPRDGDVRRSDRCRSTATRASSRMHSASSPCGARSARSRKATSRPRSPRSRSRRARARYAIDQDETPFTIDVAKIAKLKPAFGKDGTVTAASSSSISDGAAARHRHDRRGGTRARARTARAHRRVWQPRAGARVVHDRARAVDPQGARPRRLAGRATSTSTRSTRPSPA